MHALSSSSDSASSCLSCGMRMCSCCAKKPRNVARSVDVVFNLNCVQQGLGRPPPPHYHHLLTSGLTPSSSSLFCCCKCCSDSKGFIWGSLALALAVTAVWVFLFTDIELHIFPFFNNNSSSSSSTTTTTVPDNATG
mgnify:CR=1 FL=1